MISRDVLLPAAAANCGDCGGTGITTGSRYRFGMDAANRMRGREIECNCVLVEIFRICFERYREESYNRNFTVHLQLHRRGGCSYGMIRAEYCADFVNACRRATGALHPKFRPVFEHMLVGKKMQHPPWARQIMAVCGRRLAQDGLYPPSDYMRIGVIEPVTEYRVNETITPLGGFTAGGFNVTGKAA